MSEEEFRKHPAVLIFSAECDGVRGELGVLIWRLIAPASDKRYIDLAEAEGGREGGRLHHLRVSPQQPRTNYQLS